MITIELELLECSYRRALWHACRMPRTLSSIPGPWKKALQTRDNLCSLYTAFIEASFWFPIFQTVQHWDFLRITFTALYILHPTYKTQSWHEDRHSLIEWAWALFPEQASNIFCGWFHKHVEFAMMSNQKRGAYMVLTSYGWFRIWKDLLPVSTCPGMELPVLPEKLEDSHRVPEYLPCFWMKSIGIYNMRIYIYT